MLLREVILFDLSLEFKFNVDIIFVEFVFFNIVFIFLLFVLIWMLGLFLWILFVCGLSFFFVFFCLLGSVVVWVKDFIGFVVFCLVGVVIVEFGFGFFEGVGDFGV